MEVNVSYPDKEKKLLWSKLKAGKPFKNENIDDIISDIKDYIKWYKYIILMMEIFKMLKIFSDFKELLFLSLVIIVIICNCTYKIFNLNIIFKTFFNI